MSTKYIASNWRLPNEENSNKSDNYGLSFDGTELINAGNSINIITANYSISIWLKFTSTNNLVVCEKGSNDELALQVGGTGNAGKISWFGGADYQVKIDETINDGEWHHVVCVAEGSASRMYLDGVLKTIGGNKIQASANTSDFHIGSRGGTIGIVGSISELTLFDYALSDGGVSLGETAGGQISTLYGSSSLGAGNPMAIKRQPVGYWPLADNSASNPLTQPNEAVEDASVFDFANSATDFISSDVNITGDWSVSMWINTDSTSYQTALQLSSQATTGTQDSIIFVRNTFESNKWGFYDGSTVLLGSVLDINKWHNLMLTKNGTTYTLFLNGAQEGQSTKLNINITDLIIGKRSYSGFFFDGQISNVVLWNSDQSSEALNIYNSGVPATSYTNTPTAWYKLDQSANWEADSSGAWQIPDAVSAYPQSFDFDGSTQKIQVRNDSFGLTQEITVSAWVRIPNGSAGGGAPNIQAIVSEDTTGGTTRNFALSWRGSTLKDFLFEVFSTDGTRQFLYSNAGDVNDGKWHHVVGTWDGTTNANAFKIYVDNVATSTTATKTGINIQSNVPTTIGAIPNTFTWAFEGNISNVQIWDTSLDSSQVETLYNNGVPLTTAIASDNLKLWSKLDNTATWTGSAYSVPDASGNGNTGTSSGMTEQNLVNNNVSVLNGESSGMTSASLVLSDLTRAVPYDSYSFNFDAASSDYFDAGTGLGNVLGTVTQLSISLWIKADITNGNDLFFNIGDFSNSWGAISFLLLSNQLYIRINDSAYSHNLNYTSNNWNNIIFVYDGSDANKTLLYINGEEQTTTTSGVYPSSLNFTGLKTIIGAGYNTPYSFDGKISNVSVFNETLTSTEVLKLYSNGVPQNLANFTPSPQAWWTLGSNSFWNGSQWTVRDMIGSNDGTGQNIGVDGLVGDAPRSEANGTGTNMDIPTNLEGSTKWSELNSWSINMSSEARTTDVP